MDDPVRLDASVSLDDVVEVHPSVSLRPERFGALAYHFGNRRLSFLKHPDLVATVDAFDGTRTVRDALVLVGVDESRWGSFLAALRTLVASDMIRPAGAPRAA
ncbi:MAG: mycofactocin biosynthesis chaperone MftB [Microthrixaceae bacterium]|jgi:putative mycofactocin binding protein MftB